jgi:hypothetical protein
MRKMTIALAIVCSVLVGISMAVTLRILNGYSAGSSSHGAGSAVSHDMPPGMDHATHLKMMQEEAAKRQDSAPASAAMDHDSMPAGMEHDMPAGMDHATHLKMMEEATKQKAASQPASTSASSATPAAATQDGMDHNMHPGMDHATHLKMMAEAAKQPGVNGAGADQPMGRSPMDHSHMPAGMDHNMPAGMDHATHMKMMAEAAKRQSSGTKKMADQSHTATAMDHNMPAGMDHATHLKMMADAAAQQSGTGTAADQPMDHSHMPAGMDHASHMKMMAEMMAQQDAHHHPGNANSADSRPEFRDIKSLSADEIRAYQEGTGFGLAKAAEQNHYPGPRHVLDLAAQLQLSEQQKNDIENIRDAMSKSAIKLGQQLIENERKLNLLFADKKIDNDQLVAVTTESEALRGQLRLAHLKAHLETQKILSAAQIEKYDELRGYHGDDGEHAEAGHQNHPM